MVLLGLSEAAKLVGVHPTTLRRWADRGYIPHYRTPGEQRRWDEEELKKWLHARRFSSNGKDSA